MNTLAECPLTTLRLIDDPAAFVALPAAAQADILIKLGWIERIESAGRRFKGPIKEAAADALVVSVGAINRYLTWFKAEGWRGLIDERLKGTGSKGLPEAFKDWVRQLHLQHQRATTGREVHRIVVERWSKWRRTADPKFAIPGYDTCPSDCGKGYPAGWSEDQIVRLRPEAYALAVVRQGEKAGAKFLPDILKTRAGTRFGQVVFFDDQDYDNKIVAPGMKSGKTLRAQGFNALEYLSAEFPLYSIRLRWWDMDKSQYRTLTGVEATWFQVLYLQRHGYRNDEVGTTIVQEHGTMKGFANKELTTAHGHHSLADALEALSGGKIKTIASGLYNTPVFAGMLFRPQSSGNPDFKAPLEGIFNLVRNRFAALPGATGRNRDHAPAEQRGQDLYVKQMLAVHDRLDERHQELIRWPLLTAAQFGDAAAAVYAAINARTEHELEGWARCNHVVPQFRWTTDGTSPWLSQQRLAELPPRQRAAAESLMELPGHVRPVNLSPSHVADLYRKELTKIPDEWIPLLIPIQWALDATVDSNREVIIRDKMLGPEPFVYIARFRGQDLTSTLTTGTRLKCYLNPFDPSRLYICRADGSWLGVIHQKRRDNWLDHEAIKEQLAERVEMKADMDLEVRPHLEGLMRDRAEMKRTNDRLKDGKPVLPEEIAEARVAAGLKGVRTAAANRIRNLGEAIDYDAAPDPRDDDGTIDPYGNLPD